MIYDVNLVDANENSPWWYVCENISRNQKVLDVGCATGYLGEILKNNFDVDVVGVDNQDFHLDKAKKLNVYSDLIKLDLNSFGSELDEYTYYFDRIILCDVLEHLIDPMDVLRKLSRFLKVDGKFLIDIPNISHSSIKYNLLMNNFNYTSMGLLDSTHIRFFTLRSIINELSLNRFFIDKIDYVILGPGQFDYDQNVDYANYPPQVINYIENDSESAVYQIFIVFEKSDLALDLLLKHNMTFKENLKVEKERYAPKNGINPIKTLDETIQENNRTIKDLKRDLQKKNKSIKSKNRVIKQMRNSKSWKITKPLRSFTFLLRKLKNRNSTSKIQNPVFKPPKISKYGTDLGDDLTKSVYLENFNQYSDEYVKKSNRSYERRENDPKLIALYLPQFHTIKENDKWWGKGFTEWNNVTRAVPQIKGQYQPQLPDELGFYDLSTNDIFYKQIELAKKYGVYGFSFHYYWFSGKRLLEKPIFNYLNDKNLDFPFMLCWANEPWSRRWDGSENEILMPQTFEEGDYLKFIEDIMPFFKDERYIKVNNCPMLLIYRPQYFSKEVMNNAIKVWRDYVKKNGFDDLYLINAESHDFDPNNKNDVNASMQFFPNYTSTIKDENAVILNPEFNGNVFDLEAFVKSKTYLKDYNYTLYRIVMPGWDNTARMLANAMIFNNSSPEIYQEWLCNVIKYTKEKHPKDKQFIFINAWNEWAEGAHLEPDQKYGFAYLEATLRALEDVND